LTILISIILYYTIINIIYLATYIGYDYRNSYCSYRFCSKKGTFIIMHFLFFLFYETKRRTNQNVLRKIVYASKEKRQYMKKNKTLFIIVDSDNDRYADKRVDEGTKKHRERKGTRSLFFVRENHDRGYIRCIEQQGLTAFN